MNRVAFVLFALMSLCFLVSCGTLEIGIERTAMPTATAFVTETVLPATRTIVETVPTATPTGVTAITPALTATAATTTVTPRATELATYSDARFAVSLRYPSHWQPVSEGESRYEGHDGFFALDAIGNPAATIDDIAAEQTGHKLRPFGSQPTIETLTIQNQEARLILPSTDANMGGQAMLIVRYPQPIQLGEICQFLALYADQDHVRTLAQTLYFHADASSSESPASPWGKLPPGLVYRLSDALWAVDAQGKPVQVAGNANAVLSPDGSSLISYDLANQDPWLLDRTTGTGYNLTQTLDRLECCFQWWSERPGVVLFGSIEREIERGPGMMGYLATVSVDGTSYRLLDVEHDIGPGGFALSPDGRTIAYGGGSTGWLYHWGAGPEPFDPEPYGLIGAKGAQIGSPAWSSDGTRLAWVVGGGFAADGNYRIGIGVFDLKARTAILIHPYVPIGRGGWPPAPAWSPDGRWLAFEAWARDPDESGVWVVQVDGLGTKEHYLGSGGHPVWRPDGGQMAFYRIPQGGDPGIWVVESNMRELHPLGLPPDAALVDWITTSSKLTSTMAPSIEPTATEKVVPPQIASFQAVPAEVEPGHVVTLTWEASGDWATICPSARFALFAPDDCWPVPLSGVTTFTIPLETGGNRAIDFLLTVRTAGSADSAVWQRSVAFKCQRTWFFSDAPQAGICPLEPTRSYAAAQHFEHGTMIWIEQIGRYVILGEVPLHDDDTQARVAYAQDPLETVRDTSVDITAPDGFYAPTSGFGLVWRGDVAGSPGYRKTLSWALAPEFGYDTILQCDDALPSGGRSWQTCYLQDPDGKVIVLDPLDRWRLWDGWGGGSRSGLPDPRAVEGGTGAEYVLEITMPPL